VVTPDDRSQWNEVTTATGYTSSSDSQVHFGLGANVCIKEIDLRWPIGIKHSRRDVVVDRIMTVEEPRHYSASESHVSLGGTGDRGSNGELPLLGRF
jgi:hypothetical protein